VEGRAVIFALDQGEIPTAQTEKKYFANWNGTAVLPGQ